MVHNQRKRGQKSNANNQRVKKTNTDTNETTLYAWTSDRIFGEYDAQGNLNQETVYLGNTPVGIIKPEGVYRIYADQINTPRLTTDETNRPVWQWDAKPFGDSQPNEDLDGNGTPFHYNLRFPGQYYDAETKTHYNFNRDYDPETGRYIQSDPIGLDGGMNSYLYTEETPLGNFDLMGLVDWEGSVTGGTLLTAGIFSFELKTKCVNGKQGFVSIAFAGPGIGVGLIDFSFSSSDLKLHDALSFVDPMVFNNKSTLNGGFIASIGLSFGVTAQQELGRILGGAAPNSPTGFGCAAIRLGDAGGYDCGGIRGLDLGAGVFFGSSTVTASRVESCSIIDSLLSWF